MSAFINAECITGNSRRVALDPQVYEIIGGPVNASYNTLAARMFGLSYPEYCRMARDKFNGVIHGRQGGYITVTFQDPKDCDAIVKELNKRWKAWAK